MGKVTVDPVQTNTYDLNPADNPITFGRVTDIAVGSENAVDCRSAGDWSLTNQVILTVGTRSDARST